MLSDELSKKAISITVKSAEINMKVLIKALNLYLQELKKAQKAPKHGYQSLKKLNRQNYALQDIPLSSQDLRQLKQELNSYGVDYAINRDLSKPNTFKVYFKEKDAVQIENAMKNHMSRQFAKNSKPPVKEIIKKIIEKTKNLKNLKNAVILSVKSAEAGMKMLINILNSYLQKFKNAIKKTVQRYQSLKKLKNQNQVLQDIPIKSKDLRQFKRELNSYGVDYAIKKDLAQPDTFKIYFKGKDIGQIENALKNHMAGQIGNKSRQSIKERIKQAIDISASLRKELPKDKTKDLSISR